MKGFPSLTEKQVALVRAESKTGIILTREAAWKIGGGESFEVFDSLEAGRRAAIEFIAKEPTAECTVYDSRQQVVFEVRGKA